MESKESLEYLSENDFVSVAVGMETNKQKHLEAYEVIKQDLDKLEKIKSIVYKTNDEINETVDTVLINCFISRAFNDIIEVLDNETSIR